MHHFFKQRIRRVRSSNSSHGGAYFGGHQNEVYLVPSICTVSTVQEIIIYCKKFRFSGMKKNIGDILRVLPWLPMLFVPSVEN